MERVSTRVVRNNLTEEIMEIAAFLAYVVLIPLIIMATCKFIDWLAD